MEVGPSGSPCRRRAQTAAVSCRSRAGVGSDCGKGPLSAGQVSDEKTNVCEPLLTHRNRQGWHRNRRMCRTSGTKACQCSVPQPGSDPRVDPVVLGVKVAWARRRRWHGTGAPVASIPMASDVGWSREGDLRAAETVRGRVPRGTGADRLIVVMKVL